MTPPPMLLLNNDLDVFKKSSKVLATDVEVRVNVIVLVVLKSPTATYMSTSLLTTFYDMALHHRIPPRSDVEGIALTLSSTSTQASKSCR